LSINPSPTVKGHRTSNPFWRLRIAFTKPGLAWAYTRRGARICALTGAKQETVREYYSELLQSSLASQLSEKLSQYSELGLGFCGRAPELYVLTRIMRPKVVVETGVGNGISSTYFLSALEKNGSGRLVSVDFPDPGVGNILPHSKETGWLVPDELRHRWKLELGRSLDLLPSILDDLREIDFFLHDSDHTYEYMKTEMSLGWKYVKPQGILLADDAWQNTAFEEFAREVGRPAVMIANVGAIRK
jgi:predicted O-methyltransferase YrrM